MQFFSEFARPSFSQGRKIQAASRRVIVLLSLALALAGCSFKVGGSAGVKSSGDANGNATSSSQSSAKAKSGGGSKVSLKLGGNGASGKSSVKVGGSKKSSVKLSGSGKVSAKGSASRLVFKSKPRVNLVARAKTPTKFKGRTALRGSAGLKASGKISMKGRASGKGKASGQASGEEEKKKSSKTTKEPEKQSKKVEDESKKSSKTPKKQADKPKTKKPADKKKEPVVEPDPEPVDPPEEPSDNAFGYEEPVRGCFEGIVYFIDENSQHLPKSYDGFEPSSVLYACEWDIPERRFEQGFPGVEDRFEWFAIVYSGAFAVQKAGEWEFRLSSDDGAKLIIDGKVVIDNDGQHPPKVKSGKVHLDEGDHTMVLEYFQGPRYHINLQLFATPPGGEEGIFSVR